MPEAIDRSPLQIAVVLAGGGVSYLARHLARAGGSRTILRVEIPYAEEDLSRFLLGPPARAVSSETARRMADHAYAAAGRLCGDDACPAGVALTAGLATYRSRRGTEQAFLCVRTCTGARYTHVQFAGKALSREAQEEVLARCLLRDVALEAGVESCLEGGEPNATIRRWAESVPAPLRELVNGNIRWLLVHRDGQMAPEARPAAVLLPGSFHPFHRGHARMLAVAEFLTGQPADLELALKNVDKSLLSEAGVRERLRRIGSRGRVILTDTATFVEKARLFRDRTFVVGVDTATRILDPAYYGGGQGLREALAALGSSGARFLVAGRRVGRAFRTAADLAVPAGHEALFSGIPEDLFREDLSATAVRRRARAWEER